IVRVGTHLSRVTHQPDILARMKKAMMPLCNHNLAIVALAFTVSTLSAQEGGVRTGQLQTSKATLLKAAPSNTAPKLGSIDAAKPLRFVQQSPSIPPGKTAADVKAKWYQVVSPKGPLAWIRADAIDPSSIVQPPPVPDISAIAAASQKCA